MNTMDTRCAVFSLWLALCCGRAEAGSMGTAFTYQGRLTSGTNIANGAFDFPFAVYDLPNAGSQVGTNCTVTNLTYAGSTVWGSGATTPRLRIKTGQSAEHFRVNKAMRVQAEGGAVTIGR